MINDKLARILNGINRGDAIGGPSLMAKIISESLTQKRQIDPDDLVERYTDYSVRDAFDTGPTFALVFSRVQRGQKHTDAVRKAHEALGGKSSGCAPAQRIGCLAACSYVPDVQLGKQARLEASLTHFDPDAGHASAITVWITRLLLRRYDAYDIDRHLERYEEWAWKRVTKATVGDGGAGFDAVRTAWHCFLKSDDPLSMAAEISGHKNYAGPIVGAFLGASEATQ